MLQVQNDLFDLGGSLAYPVSPFTEDKLARLDNAIAHYNADLPPLKEFILPGGTRAASLCHIARTVARRAERDLVALAQQRRSTASRPALPEPPVGFIVRAEPRAESQRGSGRDFMEQNSGREITLMGSQKNTNWIVRNAREQRPGRRPGVMMQKRAHSPQAAIPTL